MVRLDAAITLAEAPPAYQCLAPKAHLLHQLGLSQVAIGPRLGTSDKAVRKAAGCRWCRIGKTRSDPDRPESPSGPSRWSTPTAPLTSAGASRKRADGDLATYRLAGPPAHWPGWKPGSAPGRRLPRRSRQASARRSIRVPPASRPPHPPDRWASRGAAGRGRREHRHQGARPRSKGRA